MGEFHFRRKYALDLVLCVENVRIVEVRVDVRRAWRSRACKACTAGHVAV